MACLRVEARARARAGRGRARAQIRRGGAATNRGGGVCSIVAILLIGATATACSTGTADDPQIAFWHSIRALCGQAFDGRIVAGSAADSAALGPTPVLEVWQCYSDELRLAVHAGEDHSRVWLLSPTSDGLALHHELHGPDGEPLEYSGYGGETAGPGTATTQVFLPDRETLADVPTADGTEWVLELVPGDRITYRLRSPATVDFRVDFDLSARAGRQPAPWGFTRKR
jgi:hypothetical protein